MKNKIILSFIFVSILLILCFNPANSLCAGQQQPNEAIQHSGKTPGSRSVQFRVPQKKLKLVHSVNKYRCNGWFYIVTSLLFMANSPYLKVISDYCIQSLLMDPRKIRESSINEGAAPSLDNYKSWVITPKGLQVYFGDYQVACYADGPSVVLIPWKVLKGVLDPHGSAGNIAFQTKKKQACEYGEFEKEEMEMHV